MKPVKRRMTDALESIDGAQYVIESICKVYEPWRGNVDRVEQVASQLIDIADDMVRALEQEANEHDPAHGCDSTHVREHLKRNDWYEDYLR
jgi:hypothetical protein